MDQKITSAIIAKEAGVSPASMSRYLKKKSSVRPATAKKIEAALASLGISVDEKKPDAFLKQPVIVVNIPGIHNTFYNEILRGIQTSAKMHFLLSQTYMLLQ